MSKQEPNLEWEIVESDADWERLPAPTPVEMEPITSRQQLLQRYLWCVAALLLVMVNVESRGWPTDQTILPARAVTAAAQRELRAVEQVGGSAAASLPGDQTTSSGLLQEGLGEYRSLYSAVQTTVPADHGDITVSTVEFGGSRGIAHIVTTPKDGAPAYRQARFYRRTATGWVQAAPDAALWGSERSLETSYFIYRFRQNDALAVAAVAPQIDALYTTLWRNFGLPMMATPERLEIEVSVTQRAGFARYQPFRDHRLVVPSSAVYWAPVELTDADLLAQSIALPLLEQALAQASERYQIGLAWQPMLEGLYLWQVWDLDLPLAAWREEVVRWLYLDLPATDPGEAIPVPTHYAALCAAHQLWLAAPLEIHLPWLCARPEWEESYRWSSRDPLTHLDQFVMPLRLSIAVPGSPHRVHQPRQTVALATLVEYAVATYGRERLPALVAGLGQYDSWETLIPAVYGVSPAKFEAGWQAYLATHYEVSLDILT